MSEKIETISRILCEYCNYNPDELEPGDIPEVDGLCANGDPGHLRWKEFIPLSKNIINAIEKIDHGS